MCSRELPMSVALSGAILHGRAVQSAREFEDDITVLRRVARGDQSALGLLYDRHASAMLALGLRILAEAREAEDLLHDVFLEAWRLAGDYDPDRGSVKTWLLVRMRSRCLDRLRSHAYARTSPLETMRPESETDADAADEHAVRSLDGTRVCRLLACLPEPQREVLVLGYFRDLSFQEIAAQLGIPLGTVKSRVSAAMGKLRSELSLLKGGTR